MCDRASESCRNQRRLFLRSQLNSGVGLASGVFVVGCSSEKPAAFNGPPTSDQPTAKTKVKQTSLDAKPKDQKATTDCGAVCPTCGKYCYLGLHAGYHKCPDGHRWDS